MAGSVCGVDMGKTDGTVTFSSRGDKEPNTEESSGNSETGYFRTHGVLVTTEVHGLRRSEDGNTWKECLLVELSATQHTRLGRLPVACTPL